MARATQFRLRIVSSALGAEIIGLDLRRDLDEDTYSALLDAWHEHLVLVFRDQELSDEDQVRFTDQFGPLGVPRRPTMPTARSVREKHPAIMLVSNIRESGRPLGFPHDGEMWFHADMCYTETPHKATMLYAVELPSTGGNTMFANMYTAYERLPKGLKARIEGLKALHVHEYKRAERPDPRKTLDGVAHYAHPMAINHPVTGRKALYVNRLMTACIEGMSAGESEALLTELFDISEDRSLVYEHEWRPGDLVMWDNRCTTHARTEFPNQERRLLRRTTVVGEPLA